MRAFALSVLVALLAAPVLAVVQIPVVVSDVCCPKTHVGLCTVEEIDGTLWAISYRDAPQVYDRGGVAVREYNNRFDEHVDAVLRVVRLR